MKINIKSFCENIAIKIVDYKQRGSLDCQSNKKIKNLIVELFLRFDCIYKRVAELKEKYHALFKIYEIPSVAKHNSIISILKEGITIEEIQNLALKVLLFSRESESCMKSRKRLEQLKEQYHTLSFKNENELEHACKNLVHELKQNLRTLNQEDFKTFFESEGAKYYIPMFYADMGEFNSNKGKSILEVALNEVNFDLSAETIEYVVNYFITHSPSLKDTHANLLHLLVQCADSQIVEKAIETIVKKSPELLFEKMKLLNGELMTPVELAIVESYNEDLINFLIDHYYEAKKYVTLEEKEKFLALAKENSNGGIGSTNKIFKRLMKKISSLNTNNADSISLQHTENLSHAPL